MTQAPADPSSEKVQLKELSNSAKRESFRYELTQGSKMLLPFNGEIQYALKNIVNYFIFIDVLIFQDSEGHALVFVGDVEMVNQQ